MSYKKKITPLAFLLIFRMLEISLSILSFLSVPILVGKFRRNFHSTPFVMA